MPLPQFNPYGRAIRKYLAEAMGSRYTVELDETVERMVHFIATKKDAENTIKLLGQLYQAGYSSAIDSAQKAIEARGFKIKVRPPDLTNG